MHKMVAGIKAPHRPRYETFGLQGWKSMTSWLQNRAASGRTVVVCIFLIGNVYHQASSYAHVITHPPSSLLYQYVSVCLLLSGLVQ